MKKVFNLILLGDPASGKATHSALFSNKYKMYDLDMGKQLRKNAKLKSTMEKGRLAPTQPVRSILKDKIFKTTKDKGIIFDGTPKMIGEARLVSKWIKEAGRGNQKTFFVYIKLPKTEILKRMAGRKRKDDTLTALHNRIKYYRNNISDVVQFFKKEYPSAEINGVGSIKIVYNRINKFLNTQNNGR